MEQYYYNRMNKIEQAVYHALYQGFLNIDEEIQIPRLEGEALYNVFFKLRLDHPEIFWATGYKYKYYNDSPNLIFVPEYLFEKAKIKEHQKAMTARVEKIAREAKTFSQWDKEKYIHDFLCESIHYDKLKKPYSHEIIGPLGHGVGVCEGIAKSVKVLCDALGIWCMIAVCGNNPEKGIKYRHTWNIVKIDGQYYLTIRLAIMRKKKIRNRKTKLHVTHRERTKPEKQNRWISGTIILTWMIKTFSGITNHCCIRLQHATRADATIIKKRNCHLQR